MHAAGEAGVSLVALLKINTRRLRGANADGASRRAGSPGASPKHDKGLHQFSKGAPVLRGILALTASSSAICASLSRQPSAPAISST